MSVIALITELTQQNIRLWLEDGQLRFSAPKGGMDEATRELLKTHKSDIIHFLSRSQPVTLPAISHVDNTALQPLSFAQERFWFLSQLEPENTAFHLSIAISLHGPLDTGILERVLNTIIERHSILRTAYVQTTTGTFQHVMPGKTLRLNQIISNTLSSEEIQAIAASEASAGFNLEEGDMVHHLLVQMPDNQFVLFCTVHHIASDGWSMAIMGQEIAALYKAFSQQQPSPLPELPVQYADFAAWQRREQSPALHRQLAYWQKQLNNIPALQFPADFPRTAPNRNQGASFGFVINKQTTAQLQALASQQQTTLFVVLLGIFSTLLFRYTQQPCFCIGTPVAGRTHSALESLIGCFLNMLALKTEHLPQNSFIEVLRGHHQTTQDAFNNQDIPFEEVVKNTAGNRNPALTPLFQVIFDLQNTPLATFNTVSDIAIQYTELEKSSALYDLGLHARETASGIAMRIEYNTGLFTQTTIQALANHFTNLTESVISSPQQSISTLALLNQHEQQQQRQQWNTTARARKQSGFLHTTIEQQAEKTPNAIALRFNGNPCSYRELNRTANRFAHYLQSLGIKPGCSVGVFMTRSLNLPIALLAILKTGASYLPLDTDFPEERLNTIVSHANLKWIITDTPQTQWQIPESGLLPFSRRELWQEFPDNNIPLAATNTECTDTCKPLLNIMYTSGSTGQPKGVMMSHAAIINRLLWMQETFPLNSEDCVLQKTPYSFDVSVWELFWPLMHGATLVIAAADGHKNPSYLHDIIVSEKITTLHFVPSMLGVFLATQPVPTQPSTPDTSLQRVFCSGETLSPSLANEFYALYPDTELVNLYGPTEAAIDVSYHVCAKPALQVPLGKPISNIELYILDQQQQLLPVGATGEICIAGAGLAEGYLHQPELSAQVFIRNPFCTPPSNYTTLYRTGDLARFDHDGNLHFLGRYDQQIKIRGLRIELGDIESQLNRHPYIREALLEVREYDNNQQLIAYYIPRQAIDAQALRDYLARQLPAFMLPNAFVEMESWPLSYNGKIDHQALPEPTRNSFTSVTFAAPRNTTEQTIAGIWAELLNADNIGIYDNFFESGGHSLLATLAVSRMQNAFGVKIPLSQIFQEPTIANCANIISLAMKTTPVLASVTTTLGDDEEEVTL